MEQYADISKSHRYVMQITKPWFDNRARVWIIETWFYVNNMLTYRNHKMQIMKPWFNNPDLPKSNTYCYTT